MKDEAEIRLAGTDVDELHVRLIFQDFIDQWRDEAHQVIDLFQLAAAVLVHPAVPRQDVQLFQQFKGLIRVCLKFFRHGLMVFSAAMQHH